MVGVPVDLLATIPIIVAYVTASPPVTVVDVMFIVVLVTILLIMVLVTRPLILVITRLLILVITRLLIVPVILCHSDAAYQGDGERRHNQTSADGLHVNSFRA